jgi:hypothetical protein
MNLISIFIWLFFPSFFLTPQNAVSTPQIPPDQILITSDDSLIFSQKMHEFQSRQSLPIGQLVAEVGLSFLNTPYEASTLENGIQEKLVINLHTFDCTTFAESCLALARTIKSGKKTIDEFESQLQTIRYRGGIRNGYVSRLHYTSDWIGDNTKKQLVDNSVNQKGVEFPLSLNFMSAHPDSYPVLKSNPELVPLIAETEKEVSARKTYYFPKDMVFHSEHLFKTGDIIGITTNIPGIDTVHMGILLEKEGHIFLLHASQSKGKVVVSEEPLADFLKPGTKNTGIMVARPIFNDL